FILLGVCISDYLLGRWLGAAKSNFLRRSIVFLNVGMNVGMLVYFKYFNLLYETFANITHTTFDALDIILPAGISFFTFRSISYIVDIYRGVMKPATNFLEYTFFLSFFPPLLAGPVVRAKDMLPQIKANPIATHAMVSEGLFLIIAGLIKKVIIADYISGNFVDRIFENPNLYSGFENMMGIFGFVIQIYCDFSGYSDMAIGIALLLGFRFKENFDSPFKSQNPTEFWRRWHISLSFWLRDYIYIPLGGNRKGKFRTHVNKMTTMIIGGLWHGASWMYLIWGAFQGVLLIGHKAISSVYRAPVRLRNNPLVISVNVLITFTLTAIGFVFFRFAISKPDIHDSMTSMGMMTDSLIHDFKPEIASQFIDAYFLIVVAIVVGYILHFTPRSWRDLMVNTMTKLNPVIQAVILAIVLFFIIQIRQSDLVPFVYLQY
ncbi:MAG: MBOAT family protein, partial [Muribaculaceae bacterium]|nr:MBOAT family protein [Muribaculaceae bacterium]